MSIRKAAVAGAVGLAAAGAAGAGIVHRRRTIARRSEDTGPAFGSLRSKGQTVVADDGTPLYVEVDEVESKKPQLTVVFCHGYALNLDCWHFQREHYRTRGIRTVFYDQRSHGRSGRSPMGNATIDHLGSDLLTVLDAVAPEGPVVLVGHSMGGMAIMALAEHAPELFAERVAGVVLISTSAGRLDEVTFGLPEVVAKFHRPLLPVVRGAGRLTTAVADRARRASSDLAWLLTRRYGFGTERPSPALVSYVEQMNSTTSTEVIARYVHTLYTHARLPALATLRTVPVLVVCGDTDVLTPLAYSEEIVRELPDAELVVVEGGGHVVLLEHAFEVNEALRRFLERTR